MTDRRSRSYPPRCTTARDDRWIVRMEVMDHLDDREPKHNRFNLLHFIWCLSVAFDTICRRVECSQSVH
ncbi:hypothetical protein TNCV_445721 [Trichonephila clavipes]|nr:hypothetical protein TNCV_445721 [Trichonephila clavipes]